MGDPGRNPDKATYNILFVCTGNTCRSPMAEALTRAALRERGWRHVEVASAGTAAADGASAADNAQRVMSERGLDIRDHSARILDRDTAAWADLTLAMAPSHLLALEAMGGEENATLVTAFLDGDDAGSPVEDPVGGSLELYRRTADQLQTAIDAMLARLEPILAP